MVTMVLLILMMFKWEHFMGFIVSNLKVNSKQNDLGCIHTEIMDSVMFEWYFNERILST